MDLIHRLHDRLRMAVAARDPAAGDVTVGEIYQQLIPYRAVRSELGLMELAPYEHALLRLLSGEGGYLRLEGDEAVGELRRELSSPNPILGIYRDYASCRVALTSADPSDAAVASTADPSPPPPLPDPVPRESDAGVRKEAAGLEIPAPPPAAEEPTSCFVCGEELPQMDDLRFCPACGADQQNPPCAACGAGLRSEWNFCVCCGQRREPALPYL